MPMALLLQMAVLNLSSLMEIEFEIEHYDPCQSLPPPPPPPTPPPPLFRFILNKVLRSRSSRDNEPHSFSAGYDFI